MRARSLDEIRDALSASGGRVAQAARILGIARNNLYKRLAASAISPSEYRHADGPVARRARPIRPAAPPRLSRSVYLRPDQIRALDEACLDLPAVLRRRLSPSQVLELLLDDCFAEWLERKLGRERTTGPRPAPQRASLPGAHRRAG